MDRKGIYRCKKWLMPLVGVIAFVAFLVMCADIAPGEEVSERAFLLPKVAAMAVMGGCVWAVKKLDNK